MSFVKLKDDSQNTIIPLAPKPLYEVDTTQSGGVVSGLILEPYYIYYFTTPLVSLAFTLGANPNPDYNAGYHLTFTTSSGGINITWPQNIIFEGLTQAPVLKSDTRYKIDIANGLCSVSVFGVDTQYYPFTGATSINNGIEGLVPTPNAGDEGKFLKGDGTWGDAGDITTSSVIFSQNTKYVQLTDGVGDIIPLSMWPESTISGTSITLQPNIAYFKTDTINVNTTISLDTSSSISGYETRYNMIFQYVNGTVSWPSGHWNVDMSTFVLEANVWYEIDIKMIHGETFLNICKYY